MNKHVSPFKKKWLSYCIAVSVFLISTVPPMAAAKDAEDPFTYAMSLGAGHEGSQVDFTGPQGPQTLAGISDGKVTDSSLEAINGRQLFKRDSNIISIINMLGGHVAENGEVITPVFSIYENSVSGHSTTEAARHNLVAAIEHINDGINIAYDINNDIKTNVINAQMGITLYDQNTTAIGLGNYFEGNKLSIKNVNDKSRLLSGVAAGVISASSEDAVNGSQLFQSNKKIGAISALMGTRPDGTRLDNKSGFDVAGKKVATVVEALDEVDISLSNMKQITDGNKSDISHLIDDLAAHGPQLVRQDDRARSINLAADTDGTVLNVAGKSGNRVVSGVQDGVNDADAVTVSQLNKVSNALKGAELVSIKPVAGEAKAGSQGRGSMAIGSVAQARGDDSVAIGHRARARHSHAVALGSNSQALASRAVALGDGSVADRANSVSIGSVGHERTLTHVAPGVLDSDAANVGQLKDLQASSNRAFSDLNKKLDDYDKKIKGGIASSMAMSGIPQAFDADTSMMGGAVASYGNQSAVAFGMSRISESGKWSTRMNAGLNTQHDLSAAVGVGYAW